MAGFSYVQGLQAMASMARQLQLPNDVAKYSNLAIAAKHAFHATFWNDTAQSYLKPFLSTSVRNHQN